MQHYYTTIDFTYMMIYVFYIIIIFVNSLECADLLNYYQLLDRDRYRYMPWKIAVTFPTKFSISSVERSHPNTPK